MALLAIIREICEQDVEADGMEFDPASIALEAIRMEDPYGGKRARIRAKLGQARIRVQVDVGVRVSGHREHLDRSIVNSRIGPS